MKTRTTTCTLLFLLLAAAGVRAQGTQHTFIQHVADTIWVDASTWVQIPVTLHNHVSSSVHLSLRVQGFPDFSMALKEQEVDIDSGTTAVQMVTFYTDSAGTFTTMLTVTDGIEMDSVLLTAVVNPVPFVLLPPVKSMFASLGEQILIQVKIQNLTPATITAHVSVIGAPDFTLDTHSPVTVPSNGAYLVNIRFLRHSVGTSNATLLVSDGNFSATTAMQVSTFRWIKNVNTTQSAQIRKTTTVRAYLHNTSGTPVALQAALTGDPGFRIDSAAQNILVDDIASLQISFVSDVAGLHTTLLTVTDGVDIDSVTLSVDVSTGGQFYTVTPANALLRPTAQQPDSTTFSVRNKTDMPLTIYATLNGDSRFYLDPSQSFVIPANATSAIKVYFMGAAAGFSYKTTLVLTDAHSRVDSLPVSASPDLVNGGNLLFITEPRDRQTITFSVPPGGTKAENVNIRNLSNGRLVVNVGMLGDNCFVSSATTVTIDSGLSATVQVTYNNPPLGRGYGQLLLESDDQRSTLNLVGMTNAWSDYAGLRVRNFLNFGGVTVNAQYCRDVWLVNTTGNSIGISNVQLTGFAPDYAITSATAFTLSAYDSATIRICYTPTAQILEDNDILSFTFDNPAANPNQGHVAVNITGRSLEVALPYLDSTRMVVFDNQSMVAPIDGFTEKTIVLQNLATRPIYLRNLTPIHSDVFSVLTPLPVSLPPYDPTVAGSGIGSIRVRYSPTSVASIPNEVDECVIHLYGGYTYVPDSVFRAEYTIAMHGTPVQAIPASSIIALYPENGLPPVIALGGPALHSTSTLRFRNNLTQPVTITSCNLESGAYSEIAYTDALPATIQPGAYISVTLRITKEVQQLTPDAIIMRGSHEHLNSRYEIYSGKMTTGIEQSPDRINGFTVHTAPNPSNGNVAIYLHETLRNGRIRILDVLGRTVADLEATSNTMYWSATANGAHVPAGSYFIHVSGVDVFGRHVTAKHKLVLLP